MQLNSDIERLAHLIADKTGKLPATVIQEALEASARQIGVDIEARPRRKRFNEADIRALIERTAALPILDNRTPEEIIGYDEHGIPR